MSQHDQQPPPISADDLVFVGFNGRVLAVDRRDGTLIWRWDEGTRSSYVSILPDDDLLLVSCRGYTWALDPATGMTLWHQPFKGEGTGIPSLATMRGAAPGPSAAAAQEEQDAAARQAASS